MEQQITALTLCQWANNIQLETPQEVSDLLIDSTGQHWKNGNFGK